MISLQQRSMTNVSAGALLLAASMLSSQTVHAQAQTSEPANKSEGASQDNVLEIVQVTGTRVLRDGYEAPTPVTVVGIEQIQASSPANVADFVNELPALSGSISPQNSNASISSGGAGVNALNLRGLGSSRTLVLLDGQRSVGSTLTGSVDVNDFPQALISRVDVVTGGASAAYGSDALSGVVNFVLDKKFTGFKSEVDGGVTTHGDDRSWKMSLTKGSSFADGRGHFLLSGEFSDKEGIFGVPRDWANEGWFIINNPAYAAGNGLPERVLLPQVGLSNATFGGIITNTALRGTTFGAGGTPSQFNYGSLIRDPWMQGGAWQSTQVNNYNTLDPEETRESIFTRASYDVTDNIEMFVQVSRSRTHAVGLSAHQYNLANLVVKADNAFLPDEVAAQAAALGITQFTMGKLHGDLPIRGTDNRRDVNRYIVGANGDFDLFGSGWNWDAYYQKGIATTSESVPQTTNNARFALATDAVRNPATGAIACRSSIANPGNGCVPYNLFGIGVNSQAALDYVLGRPHRNQEFTQDVTAASVSGEPFSLWAGPVSLAFGAEHRKEEVSGDVESQYRSGWFVGNFLPTFGEYKVTEGFVETVVPLAKDLPWTQSLEFNGAVRVTDYSTSGVVTTWKAGATWSPISDVMFRVTRSRDIRAPNLAELFQAGTANTNSVIDPFNNNQIVQYTGARTGNPDLVPEEADTTGFGVVLQPSFLPGFSASFDYFNIDIGNSIGSVDAQTIVDRCFEGTQSYCAAITRGTNANGANVITQIRLQPFNFVTQVSRGFDVEASYRLPLDTLISSWGGDLSVRALATHYLKNFEDNGIDPATDSVGQNGGSGPPEWRYRASIAYSNEPLTFTLTGRGVSSGVYDNTFIECDIDCPTSTVSHRTINDNRIEGAFYLDANLTYEFGRFANGLDMEVFLSVRNLTDKDPALVAQGPGGIAFLTQPANPTLYDTLGRVFRAGVRIKM